MKKDAFGRVVVGRGGSSLLLAALMFMWFGVLQKPRGGSGTSQRAWLVSWTPVGILMGVALVTFCVGCVVIAVRERRKRL